MIASTANAPLVHATLDDAQRGRAFGAIPTQPSGHPGQPSRPANVLVADPFGKLREALRPALIQHGGCHLVHARTATEVDDLIAGGLTGELAMISVQFNTDTPSVIRTLRGAGWVRVIALTTSTGSLAPVLAAFDAGASGVLNVACTEPDPVHPVTRLTARELEVVRLVAGGRSNKMVADQLSLSALTVKHHMARIGRKLGVGDRAHIVAVACRGGVIPGLPGSVDRPD